ncbi:hypothetical protein EV426DRAFT_705089 [Tirmania nivea]|nr:hypothetical protein EV426DRAFT_705089 [Tirmania nivea]
MSEAIMPISTDALYYRTLLFELSKLVTIPAEKFDEIWPYVDSVYTSLSGGECGHLQQQLYAIHESMDHLHLEDKVQDQRVEECVNHVQATLDSLTSLRAEDIASRNRPWEL